MTMKEPIIQIPCTNKAVTLSENLAALPREIPGIEQIGILIIDRGRADASSWAPSGHSIQFISSSSRF